MKKAILGLAIALLLACTGCTSGSYSVKTGNELNSSTRMSMQYTEFSGYKQTTLTVKDEPVDVTVSFVTESGTLDAYIAKDNDTAHCSYQGENVPTATFVVTLSEPGKYTLRVDGEKHVGSYSFSWGK